MIRRSTRLIIVVMLLASMSYAQPICFDDTTVRPGTTVQVYDSSIFIPPEELTATLAPAYDYGKQADVKVRTEQWDVIDSLSILDRRVTWSRYDVEQPFYSPDSTWFHPTIGTCYHIVTSPYEDTTASLCSGEKLTQRTRQNLIGQYTYADYPELILRLFSGVCLRRDKKDEIKTRVLEGIQNASSQYGTTVVNSWIEWEMSDVAGAVDVFMKYTDSTRSRKPNSNSVVILVASHNLKMTIQTGTGRLLSMHEITEVNGSGIVNGEDAGFNSIMYDEKHMTVYWHNPNEYRSTVNSR